MPLRNPMFWHWGSGSFWFLRGESSLLCASGGAAGGALVGRPLAVGSDDMNVKWCCTSLISAPYKQMAGSHGGSAPTNTNRSVWGWGAFSSQQEIPEQKRLDVLLNHPDYYSCSRKLCGIVTWIKTCYRSCMWTSHSFMRGISHFNLMNTQKNWWICLHRRAGMRKTFSPTVLLVGSVKTLRIKSEVNIKCI